MKLNLARILLVPLLALAAGPGFAADTSSPSTASADKLAPVRAHLAGKNYAAAVDELKKASDPSSADWNNLMGYSLRRASASNAGEAEKYYNEALRINPKHRGALEYSGELYLMTGDLAKAEQRLAALDKACFLPCDEHRDLKAAIARYKQNGNKYVAGDW